MQRKLFLAVPCPGGTQASVRSVIDELQQACSGVRWNRDEDLHITLAFLGLTDEALVGEIVDSLRSVTETRNEFVLELDGVGAFPSDEEPVTLWAGVGEGIRQLRTLQRIIVEQLAGLGFETEARSHRPHLTLGRVLDSSQSAIVGDAIARYAGRAVGSLVVSDVGLYSSEMTHDGPRYEAIASLPITTSEVAPSELVGIHIQGVVIGWHIHGDSVKENGFYFHLADGRFIEAHTSSGLVFRRSLTPED